MKVVKFGGSSMADAGQYRKIREILQADPERKVVVVSAAGKRTKDDHKITDLLYLCHAHTQYGVDCSGIFEMISSRYLQIRDDLGIDLDLGDGICRFQATHRQEGAERRRDRFPGRVLLRQAHGCLLRLPVYRFRRLGQVQF